ncbi:LapA family protein [Roseateles sp. DAIF2]|uniref:LapA family protein n=1 Tax=Roseateles sp. DAIF2 TaxID=2714952 RepID=UPI0018A333F2|nr:LapA family protein [Roseateles sp. DAIF2]QPF73669.1 LapA family protein [Roseateles sp. DAIF2]
MRVFVWLFRAFIFFALFAFALNNSQEVEVRWFFGHEWHAPMVIIVLLAFGCGAALGVLAMVPAWWKHRRVAQRQQQFPPDTPAGATAEPPTPNAGVVRDGL